MLDVDVGGTPLRVEVADDPMERERGLTFRRSIRRDHGMLFVFPDARPRSFWTVDTPLALSLAYLDGDGRIITLLDPEPNARKPLLSVGYAQYAIETERGWFADHGLGVGTVVGGLPGPAAQ